MELVSIRDAETYAPVTAVDIGLALNDGASLRLGPGLTSLIPHPTERLGSRVHSALMHLSQRWLVEVKQSEGLRSKVTSNPNDSS